MNRVILYTDNIVTENIKYFSGIVWNRNSPNSVSNCHVSVRIKEMYLFGDNVVRAIVSRTGYVSRPQIGLIPLDSDIFPIFPNLPERYPTSF